MIDLQLNGPIAVIILCRGPVNGLNAAWVERFDAVLDEVRRADAAVVIIRSNQRVFCAGADLRYFSEAFSSAAGRDELHRFVAALQKSYATLEAMPQVSIAEIGGPAMGGGLELALACDFRLLSDAATVGLPEVRIGLIPGAGGTQRLSRNCGTAVARRMILSAQQASAKEALRWGVVDWLAPAAEIHAEALRHAARFASLSKEAIGAAKACLAAFHDHRRDGYAEEIGATRVLLDSEPTQERVRRFLGKTLPSV